MVPLVFTESALSDKQTNDALQFLYCAFFRIQHVDLELTVSRVIFSKEEMKKPKWMQTLRLFSYNNVGE